MTNRPIKWRAIGFLVFLPSFASAEIAAQNTRYSCERGVQIPVVYATSNNSSIAVLTVEGKQILLYSDVSANGKRYVWPSDGSNYVWLSNGTKAALLWHDGVTNTEIPLLSSCKQN